MATRFEVFIDTQNKWRFRLKARNGEIIASSEAYESKQGCLKGVKSIKRNALLAPTIFIDLSEEPTIVDLL